MAFSTICAECLEEILVLGSWSGDSDNDQQEGDVESLMRRLCNGAVALSTECTDFAIPSPQIFTSGYATQIAGACGADIGRPVNGGLGSR